MLAKVFSIFFSFFATAVLLFFVFREQSFENFLKLFQNTDINIVFLFSVISVLGAVFRMLRYRLLLGAIQPENKPGCGKLLITTFARNAFVDMFPLRLGETIYIYMLNRFGIPLHAGVSSFGVCIILDVMVLLFIFAVLLLFNGMVSTIENVGVSVSSAEIAILLLGLLVVSIIFYNIEKVAGVFISIIERTRLIGFKVVNKIIEIIKILVDDFEYIKKSRTLVELLFFTFVLRALKYGSLYVLLYAVISPMGYTIENHFILPIFVAFIAAEASASLPASGFLGIGLYQGVWATIITLLGLKIENPLSVSLAVQVISQVFTYILGIISVLMFLIIMLKTRRD